MDFRSQYPDFAEVEEHIRRAKLERSLAIAHFLVGIFDDVHRGLRRLAAVLGASLRRAGEFADRGERDRLAIQADAFVKRWVPKH